MKQTAIINLDNYYYYYFFNLGLHINFIILDLILQTYAIWPKIFGRNKSTPYNDILGNSVSVSQAMWQQFGDVLFHLSACQCPQMHKARSIKQRFSQFGVEKLIWPV